MRPWYPQTSVFGCVGSETEPLQISRSHCIYILLINKGGKAVYVESKLKKFPYPKGNCSLKDTAANSHWTRC